MSGVITSSTDETLRFDVVLTEQYGPKNAVTEFPIEDGSTFSDHIQRKPLTFTIVGIISETPFSDDPISETRLVDTILFLDRAANDIVTYTSTRFGLIETLTIESWSYTNDVLNRLEFTVGFKQIRIAQAEIVRIPRPIQQAAKAPRPCGEQPAKKEIDVTKEENKEIVEDEELGGLAYNLLVGRN
jgi:hypothetical protein